MTERTVRIVVAEINLTGHEFFGLGYLIEKLTNALGEVPEQHRSRTGTSLHDTVLHVWYERPATKEEQQERNQFEILRKKYEHI